MPTRAGGSDIELAIQRAKRLESLLQTRLGAEGRGLHDLVSSVAGRFTEAEVRKFRYVATVRNKLAHEAAAERIDDRAGFVKACDELERAIARAARKRAPRRLRWIAIAFAVLAMAGVAAYYWWQNRF